MVGLGAVGHVDLHLFGKEAVEEVEGAFVAVVLHVVDVRVKGPVDCFGAELDVPVDLEQRVDGPCLVDGPLCRRLGDDEGFVGQ